MEKFQIRARPVYLLTRLAAAEPLSDDEGSADEVADGGPGGLALPARGSGDGGIAGVDTRPPIGTEAVGHFPEDHGWADFLLAAVVNRHAVFRCWPVLAIGPRLRYRSSTGIGAPGA